MSNNWKIRLLLAFAVCSIAGAVLAITSLERAEETRVSRQLIAGQQMLSAIVEAHAALHSYAGDAGVNDAVVFGLQERAYLAAARSAYLADTETTRRASLTRQNVVARTYFRRSQQAIDDLRARRIKGLNAQQNDVIARLLHQFEDENSAYVTLLQHER